MLGVPLSSTHQFHFWTTPFQPQKSLSSTPKTPQFHTKNPSVPPQFSLRDVWNWGVFSVELRGVELRGFGCGTDGGGREGFLVWNWGIFGAEKVWSRSGTDVLNWGICVELRGTPSILTVAIKEPFF